MIENYLQWKQYDKGLSISAVSSLTLSFQEEKEKFHTYIISTRNNNTEINDKVRETETNQIKNVVGSKMYTI